jgi:AraC-like DNA-binding protein
MSLELAHAVAGLCPTDGINATPIDGLVFMRASAGSMLPSHSIYRPCLCAVVQGAKQVSVGDQTLDYGLGQCLIVSVDLPAFGRVTQASVDEPYLAIALEFDVQMIRAVLEELPDAPVPAEGLGRGILVAETTAALTDCLLRLVRLLATPQAIPVLYPAIMKEVCFWLLTGPHGSELCKLALPDGHTRRIAQAIYLIREHFTRAIRVQELAAAARMSLSSFHEHFKAVTSMTPLQYQKQLRLLEARRLMLVEGSSASGAAYQVGYESASQFSREYSRMFGVSPRQDAVGAPAGSSDVGVGVAI